MRLKSWLRAIAFVMVALAAFAAVESVTCAEDFGACCAESHCCGCVHVSLQAPSTSLQFVSEVFPLSVMVFQTLPNFEIAPLLRPPIA